MGTNSWTFVILLLFMIAWMAHCQRDNVCNPVMVQDMPKRSGDNGYHIRIDRLPTDYVPGQLYRVLLQAVSPVSFRQFFLVATLDEQPSQAGGTFGISDRLNTQFHASCSHAITHTFPSSKTSISVQWTAPPVGSGCVNFRAGVVQKKKVWFAEDGDLTLQLCERVSEESGGPSPSPTPDPHACCAPPHQEAKYRFTFVSTWTPQTHPNQYPTGRGNHWSDLIGASHSSDYTIWDYGQYASFGVKMVAEWGSPLKLEEEIREEGNNVKTVILSRGLFPAYAENLRNMSAYFKTDSQHNLVSAISMMGPSPDWCVGISKINMCTEDCSWAERREFYLQPWDAGTDSGIQYNSRNSPQRPPNPIRPITSSDPDNPQAPFYDASGAPIPPLATVVLERVSIRNISSTETDPIQPFRGGHGGGMPPKTGMMNKNLTMPPKVMGGHPTMPPKVMDLDPTMPPKVMPPKVMEVDPTMPPKEIGETMPPKRMRPASRDVVDCMMTAWGDWTECSKTCGKGRMTRQRMIKRRPKNGGEPCGPTKEKKSCNLAKCMSKRRKSRDCRMGEWGPWSGCSVSCGEGVDFRMRDIVREARGSGAPCEGLKQMRVCEADPCL